MPKRMNNFSVRASIRLIALLGTFLAAVILLWTSDEPSPPDTVKSAMEEPDSYLVNGVYREYGVTGELNSKMSTRQGVHFPDSDEGIFSSPDILIYQEDRTPWTIKASQGQYLSKQEQLVLKGNVVIEQLQGDVPVLNFQTDELSLYTKTKYIVTDRPVKISGAEGLTSAIGMKVWVNEKRVELLSNVKGTYVLQAK
jgi:lipopolysaccharide export system protein LptC